MSQDSEHGMASREYSCCKEGYNLEFTKPLEETGWEKLILRRQLETNAEAICGKMGIQCRYLVKASVAAEKRPTIRLAASDT